ncbi:MAG: type 2 isopentenyl-diphosphate Delta-isomerase [Myxococcota bacterium]
MSELVERKRSHLELCATREVEHTRGTLLDQVHLLHEALPEAAAAEVDLSIELFGRRLEVPVLISGMSGGSEEAGRLNRGLASVAAKCGLGMGVGSQRAMLLDPERAASYRVREVAPEILLLANLGSVQARDHDLGRIVELVAAIEADALCVHLNPAQELVQDEGDRDFRGCLAAISRIARTLPVPVIVKETGCGMAPRTLARLRDCGVRWVDVSGAGGTSWTGVESLRGSHRQRKLGEELRSWGIPTAPSILFARRAGLNVIASGGIRGGLDGARALALGARAVSLALPFLRAFDREGIEGAQRLAGELAEALRAAALLTGAVDVAGLQRAEWIPGPELAGWLQSPRSGSMSWT